MHYFSLLVTGSEDSTVFSFTITTTNTYPVITPIGFIKVPSGVTCLTWKPQCVNNMCYIIIFLLSKIYALNEI